MRVLVLLLAASCSTALPSIDTSGPLRDPEVAATCTADSILPGVDTTFAVVAAGLAVVIISEDTDSGVALIGPGLLLGIPAFVLGASAAHGYLSLRDCKRERAKPLAPASSPSSAPSPLARDLAESARLAARRGDCTTARALAARIRGIDESYYAEVAGGDAALVACVRDAKSPGE